MMHAANGIQTISGVLNVLLWWGPGERDTAQDIQSPTPASTSTSQTSAAQLRPFEQRATSSKGAVAQRSHVQVPIGGSIYSSPDLFRTHQTVHSQLSTRPAPTLLLRFLLLLML